MKELYTFLFEAVFQNKEWSHRGKFDYPVELQKKYFIEQIRLANKYELPIIIHSRESQEDVYKILRENVVKKAGIMHCYSGTPKMSKKFVEMGYFLGIGGPVTRYKDVQETVKITPIDKIVIETDSPVLPPEPFEKHSRNNSMYLNYIVKKITINVPNSKFFLYLFSINKRR